MPERSEDSSVNDIGFFHRKPLLLWASLALMLLLAIVIRVANLESSHLIAEVQFRAALIARGNYFDADVNIPQWRRDINAISIDRLPIKEPSISEFLAASLYRLAGQEDLRLARLLMIAYWIIGGFFLFALLKRYSSAEAALLSTGYYLFVPLGVHASISFVSDPLMMLLFIISLFTIVFYYERPTKRRLFASAVIASLAVLAKPLVLFVLVSAFLALAIYKADNWKRVVNSDVIVFMVILLVPVALYYLYGIFIAGFLTEQAEVSFVPQLLLQRTYWKDWLLIATSVVGLVPLLMALIGLPMQKKGLSRAMLIGLWVGYVFFGLVFTYHIRFAGHYHLQLIVIVALSMAPVIDLVTGHLQQLSNRWYWWLPVGGALALLLLFNYRELRGQLASFGNYESEQLAVEVGEIVNHSSRVVYLASYYGRPLEYFAEISGTFWPRSTSDIDRTLGNERSQSVEARLRGLDFSPEYFVITDFREYDRHHADLDVYLTTHCLLTTKSDQYLIYGSCQK